MTRKELREEVKRLSLVEDTAKHLRQHVINQVACMATMEKERHRLREQCQRLVALINLLPDDLMKDALRGYLWKTDIEQQLRSTVPWH